MHPENLILDKGRQVTIFYKNYREELKEYLIIPHNMWFGRTDFHPGEEQWFIRATDVNRNVVRDFAWLDVQEVCT